jgi:hypothetical protein
MQELNQLRIIDKIAEKLVSYCKIGGIFRLIFLHTC